MCVCVCVCVCVHLEDVQRGNEGKTVPSNPFNQNSSMSGMGIGNKIFLLSLFLRMLPSFRRKFEQTTRLNDLKGPSSPNSLWF